jgi:hypothetical protein
MHFVLIVKLFFIVKNGFKLNETKCYEIKVMKTGKL